MMDGYYTTPGGGRGKTNQKGLAVDTFQATVTFFTHEKQDLVIFVAFLVALKGAPGGSQRGPWDYEWFIYHLRRKTL